MSLSNEPIVILGAFRSGTSCLAIVLAELGVYLGAEEDFLRADEFNEGGYQELEDLENLNARCLAAFGMNYFQAERLPADWQHRPGSDEMVSLIAETLNRHFAGHPIWGWKEPSTTILMPLYKAALSKEGVNGARYPISIRHPLSVAASQTRRQTRFGFLPPTHVYPESEPAPVERRTVGVWMHHTLSALMETRGSFRQVFSYENFLATPRPYLEKLLDGMSGLHPTNEDIESAIAKIKPELSHSRYKPEDLEGLPSIVARTYDCGLRAEQDCDGLNAGKFDDEIQSLWEEWTYMSEMAKPIFLPFTDMFLTWKNGRTTVKWTSSGSWQIVRGTVNVGGGETIQIDPSPLPCLIWIKSATWRFQGKERKAVLKQGINGILENFGTLRLLAYGPCPLITQTPEGEGPFELELEWMAIIDPAVLIEMITRMRIRMEQMVRAAPPGRR